MERFRIQLEQLIQLVEFQTKKKVEILGVSRQLINKYRNPTKEISPTYETIEKIAKHFRISAHYFFSSIPPDRFYKMERAKAIWPNMAELTEIEQDVVLDLIKSFAKSKAALQIDQDEENFSPEYAAKY